MTNKMPTEIMSGSAMSTCISFIAMERDLHSELADGERILGRFVLPKFQRPAVWTMKQRIRLIESLWLGLPIASFVYNRSSQIDGKTDQWLIDGQQRITTILSYLNDEFEVFGSKWSDVDVVDRRGFNMKPFPCYELRLDDEAKLEDIYNRLAYGGTVHG
jgi:uncharacterized protein with ParB-like and HNH nuclease domain